jgi:hypothetical protein
VPGHEVIAAFGVKLVPRLQILIFSATKSERMSMTLADTFFALYQIEDNREVFLLL